MRWVGVATLWIACIGAGCDEGKRAGGGSVDSESHWLEACADDSTCGGLACVCGVCSRPCDDACDDFTQAVCAPFAGCRAGERICVPEAMPGDAGPGADAAPDTSRSDDDAAPPARDAAMSDDGPDAGQPADAAPDVGPATDAGPDAAPCPPENACCADEDCPVVGSRCAPAGSGRQGVVCDPGAPAGNFCLRPECAVDGDCGREQRCMQPGEQGFTVATCVPARCAANADCVEVADGECLGFFTACNVAGFACWYPGNICRVDDDCVQRAEPMVCVPRVEFGTQCVPAE